MAQKSSEKKAEKKHRLMQAALELFEEKGPDKVTVLDIANRAGVGKGTFYLYFHSKEEILDAAFSHALVDVLNDSIRKGQKQFTGSAVDNLLILLSQLIDCLLENRMVLKRFHRDIVETFSKVAQPRILSASLRQLIYDLGSCPRMAGRSREEVERYMYLYFIMVAGFCFDIREQRDPSQVSQMKAGLLDIIRASLV